MKFTKMSVALLVVGLAAFAGTGPASAQSNAVLVKVPFAFIAGDRVLPAGSYRLAADPQDHSVLFVTSIQHPADAVMVATGMAEPPEVGDPSVRFKNVGGHMFLWEVAVPGDGAREITVTRAAAERTLVRLNLMPAEPAGSAK